jgi:hypothetical protein
MNSADQKPSIVIAGSLLCDHVSIQKAMLEKGTPCQSTSVYSHAQLLDYLLKRGSYSHCPEPFPDCILLCFKETSSKSADTVKQLRYFSQLKNIPVYILSNGCSVVEREFAIASGTTGVYDVQQGYSNLASLFLPDNNAPSANDRMVAA